MQKIGLKAAGAVLAVGLLASSQAYAGGSKDYQDYGPAWAGFYFGGHAGGGFGNAEVDFAGFHIEDDSTGFVAGLQIGYNWQSDSLVYGIEGDLSFGDGTVGTIRGRIGQAIDNMLIYVTAGVAFANVDDDVDFV